MTNANFFELNGSCRCRPSKGPRIISSLVLCLVTPLMSTLMCQKVYVVPVESTLALIVPHALYERSYPKNFVEGCFT